MNVMLYRWLLTFWTKERDRPISSADFRDWDDNG